MRAVSDAVGNLSCSGVSWNSVQLFWEPPANPNGQILYYEIVLEVKSDLYTRKANVSEYTVTGLSPDQEYTLSVAAINSAGPGDRVNCTASTLSESGKHSVLHTLAFRDPVFEMFREAQYLRKQTRSKTLAQCTLLQR